MRPKGHQGPKYVGSCRIWDLYFDCDGKLLGFLRREKISPVGRFFGYWVEDGLQ